MAYWKQELFGDFRNYLFYVWTKVLKLPKPTKRQYSVAQWLEHGPRRQIEEGFRGIGKSWITSAFVTYVLGKYYIMVDNGAEAGPEPKFLVVSASKRRSDDFSIFTMQLIHTIPELQFLIPNKDQRQSKIAFDVGPCSPSHAPSVKSVGIFGQLAGSRATHIIPDDVEIANNSGTQDSRDKLLKACMEFEAIITPEVGRITYLGTPQTEESIYNKLKSRGYACRVHPALYPSEEQRASYNGTLDPEIESEVEANPKLVGKPTDPDRFSARDLEERRLVYGNSGFSLQFMLDTSLSDAERYPLRTSDIIVMDLNPDITPVTVQYGSGPQQALELSNVGFAGDRWYGPMYISADKAPYEGVAMAIDPAGRGGDELSYAVGAHLHGRIHVPAAGGLKGGYTPANLQRLADIARDWKVNQVVIESNFGDGMFMELLKPVFRKFYPGACAMEEVRSTVQKEKRIIDTLEPTLNQHRLIVDPRVIKEDLKQVDDDQRFSLFYQLTRITRERGALSKDDRVDALALLVAFWVKSMARDAVDAEDTWRQEQIDRGLEAFMDGIFLNDPRVSSEGFLSKGRESYLNPGKSFGATFRRTG